MAAAPREAPAAKGGKETAKAAESAPVPKKKKNKLVLVAIVATVLLAGGGGAAYFFLKPHPPAEGEHAEEAKAAATKVPVFLPLDTFTVNLRDQGAERYLQAGITLELGNEESAERMKAHLPIARSAILLLLSSKEAQDLAKVEDKNRLATDIVAELGKLPAIKDAKVSAVHFSAFVIQ